MSNRKFSLPKRAADALHSKPPSNVHLTLYTHRTVQNPNFFRVPLKNSGVKYRQYYNPPPTYHTLYNTASLPHHTEQRKRSRFDDSIKVTILQCPSETAFSQITQSKQSLHQNRTITLTLQSR